MNWVNKKKEGRNAAKILVTMAIGVLPEIVFAWIVGNLLDIAVWKVWLWIQGITLASMGVKSLLEYVAYRFVWKNGMVEGISADLSALNYPNPKKYSFNTLAEDYFGSVMQDDVIKIDTRLDAAYVLGTIKSQNGIIDSIRVDSAFREAIDKYHRIKFGGKDYSEEADESDS